MIPKHKFRLKMILFHKKKKFAEFFSFNTKNTIYFNSSNAFNLKLHVLRQNFLVKSQRLKCARSYKGSKLTRVFSRRNFPVKSQRFLRRWFYKQNGCCVENGARKTANIWPLRQPLKLFFLKFFRWRGHFWKQTSILNYVISKTKLF